MGIHGNSEQPENIIPFSVNLPMEFHYWNPLGEKWNSVFMGIGGAGIGVDFIPPQKKIIIDSSSVYFSLGAGFSYNFGLGKEDMYSLNYHTVQIQTSLTLHTAFNERHAIYLTASLYYEMEFLKIIEKYKDEELHFTNMAGLKAGAGYEFKAGKNISIYTKTDFSFHFSTDNFLSIECGIGTKIKLKEGDNR